MARGGRRRTALLAVALLLTAALTGCGDKDSSGSTSRPGGSTTRAEPLPTPASTTTSPDAVDPPGPRTGPLLPADLLVFSQDTLTPGMVTRIAAIPGVTHVEPMAMAQVSIENRVLNLAAVNPATYRNYTPFDSAELQEEWDRVAAGQLALLPKLKKKVPAKGGYLRLGNGKDAPQVPIGAYAPQVPQVDAVVNTKVGEALGMRPGNALLVSVARLKAPQSVRKPIERIAGSKASVQILGPDLDISVRQTAFLVGTVADAVGVFNYTVLGGGRIAPEASWVASHIATQNVPILGLVTCNRLIFPQLTAALNEVVSGGLADQIHPSEYAGCYYPRFIAGTTKLSNHSFGLALDLNVPGNQRGTVGEMDRGVVSIFESWGFTWGGRWSYTDPMHFEMNRVVRPG